MKKKKIELQRVSPDKSCRLLHTGQKVVISKCLKYPFCVTSNFFMQKSREAPQKMHVCTKMQFFWKILPESRDLVLRLPTVNNAAPERATGGSNRRTLKGKSDIRSNSARRPPFRFQFFCTKCSGSDVKVSFSTEGRCHSQVVVLYFYAKPSVGSKSQFRATTRWRLLIPSIQKSFFFFFPFPDRLWRGRGRTITPCVKTLPLGAARGAQALCIIKQFIAR